MEEYFVVKSRLFTPEHSQRAVIWGDDPYGERLATSTTLPVTRVSRRDATDVETSLTGHDVLLAPTPGELGAAR